MSDYGYGQGYDAPKVQLKGGINDGVYLKSIEVVDLDTANYTGKAADIIFQKGDTEVKCRRFPVDPNRATPREVYDKKLGEKRMETEGEAKKRVFTEFNSWFKHIVSGYEFMLDKEGVYEKGGLFEQETSKATNFESFIGIVKKFLPKGYENVPGKIILSFKDNGFTEVPEKMWLTGNWWAPEGSGKELVVNPKYIKTIRPVQQEEPKVTDTPATDTEW